ncbi:MAG: energy-coupling factor transporter transmembrane protein EcfT [Clostridia bacterium]|nr:energy-coupling factor transporter transmembrane protein EcfT [Clostridia bacterium]
MISDITLGQYFPGTSILHKMDPRVKILLTVAYIVAIFLCKYVLTYALMLLFTAWLVLASGISFKTILRSLRPIVIILIITALINVLFTGGEGEPLFVLWKIRVYEAGLWRALFMALRVVMLVAAGSLFLTYTTSPIALTDAIEALLSPLRLIRVPVHEFAMMMTIALRFIPILIEEAEKIMNAQKSRGADLSTGGPVKRIKGLVPIIVPLFISAFQRAMDLATAMECRCYRGGKGRTKLRRYRVGWRDLVMVLLMTGVTLGIVLGNRHLPALVGWGYSL